MATLEQDVFKIWAVDNMVYGPVDPSTLIQWAEESRVQADTWVHTQSKNSWLRAGDLAWLTKYFPTGAGAEVGIGSRGRSASGSGSEVVSQDELRQFALFSGLSNNDLCQFARFAELVEVPAGELILRKGAPCDAVYFVLSGQVRARLVIQLQETTLGQIPAGQFFGEVGMFIQATRTADVVADTSSRLLRLSSEAFQLLIEQVPALAAPLLFSIAKTMASRISDDNQRLQKEITSGFSWR